MSYRVGIDLGGTNIVAGVVDDDYNIISKASCKTNVPRPETDVCDSMAAVVKEAVKKAKLKMDDIDYIGIGVPGAVNPETRIIETSPNLFFKNWEIAKMMEERLHKYTKVENDANAAALGEFLAGSAKGTKNAIAITLGTGVGGGIVFDGKMWEGMNGFAAEMGHMVIDPQGRACPCGKRGCVETYCSATALIKETKRMMKLYPESKMWEDVGGDIERASGKTAFRAAERGDAAAKLVLGDFIGYLALAVANIINVFQPDVVCIGGGISREGENLLAPLRDIVLHNSFGTETSRTKVVAATFRNDAGIIGAAVLGLQDNKI